MVTLIDPMDEDYMSAQKAMILTRFMHGECVTMALAMHRALGEGLVVVAVAGRLVHAGTRTAMGLFRDVRGAIDRGAFTDPYPGGEVLDDVDEATVRGMATAGGGSEITDAMVEEAEGHANLIHADLPGARAYSERIRSFGDEMTALCRRHGLFLREAFPNGMLLYEAYGDEAGYGFRPISRNTLVATRLLA